MKILDILREKKRLVRNSLIKKLGGISLDEQFFNGTIEFVKSEKDILTLKATKLIAADVLFGNDTRDVQIQIVRNYLAEQLLEELKKSHMIEYSTGEEDPIRNDISVSATIRVVKP